MKLSACLMLACVSISANAQAPTVSPLISISPAEFLKLPNPIRSVYVGGVLDGMTFVSYGSSDRQHDRFVACARTITLGDLANKTVDWLKARPNFDESGASAIAQTLGAYCKSKGLR
jgi:hypothetical protein